MKHGFSASHFKSLQWLNPGGWRDTSPLSVGMPIGVCGDGFKRGIQHFSQSVVFREGQVNIIFIPLGLSSLETMSANTSETYYCDHLAGGLVPQKIHISAFGPLAGQPMQGKAFGLFGFLPSLAYAVLVRSVPESPLSDVVPWPIKGWCTGFMGRTRWKPGVSAPAGGNATDF